MVLMEDVIWESVPKYHSRKTPRSPIATPIDMAETK